MHSFLRQHHHTSGSRGFSLVEILVVLAIVCTLTYLGVIQFTAMRDRAELRAATNTIVLHLEEVKTRAVAGTGGVAHGIWFGDGTYVQFTGGDYDPDDSTNVTHTVDEDLVVTVETEGVDEVVFERITGRTENAVVISVSLADDPTTERVIIVGNGGDISQSE